MRKFLLVYSCCVKENKSLLGKAKDYLGQKNSEEYGRKTYKFPPYALWVWIRLKIPREWHTHASIN